ATRTSSLCCGTAPSVYVKKSSLSQMSRVAASVVRLSSPAVRDTSTGVRARKLAITWLARDKASAQLSSMVVAGMGSRGKNRFRVPLLSERELLGGTRKTFAYLVLIPG